MNSKLEQLKEYARIIKDTPYAMKTYLQTYDNTQSRFVPLDLFPDQIQLINDYENFNENITRKYRQAGVTTVTAAWISKKLQTAKPEKPEKVLIVANKRDTAVEMANKIRAFIEQWPPWINVGFSQTKNSEQRFRLNNGCEVKAVATSKDALRGYTPTILVFDEAAYIEAGEDFWAASMASLSCVHENSYILTNKGLYKLKNIIEEKEKFGFSPYNGDIQIINENLKITTIKNTFKSEKSICYKITTKNGFELIGSYKHPLKVKQQENDIWVWMENLKIGDQIKLQYNQNLFGEDEIIDFKFGHFNEQEKIKLPKKLNENLDIAYLIGLFIAEGSLSNNTIQIANGDLEIENFLIKMGFIKNRENHFYLCSSHFTRFLTEYIGLGHCTAEHKIIPDYILKSSKEVITAVLQGMFDGDGCSFKKGVKYTTTSKELSQQLQILLSNFGIKTFIRYSEEKTSSTSILTNKNHLTKTYNLFIKGEDVLKFYNDIGFRLKRKQENIKYFINKIQNKSFLYATKEELLSILKENKINRTQYEKNYRFLDLLMRKNKDHITYHAYNKIISKNLKNKTTLNKWIERFKTNKHFYYDEIISIETFDEYTYDLEVPDGHTFITNSIISHNTGGKIILISTPNGFDPIYYGIYEQAVRGANNFKITELKWYNDPRYAKDVKWIKCNDIVHYMLNREEYNDDEITLIEHDQSKFDELIQDGYKPYSPWFENMAKKFKYDKRKINQEINADFLGSGDNVIPPELIGKILKESVRDPKEKYMMGQMWQWKDPIKDHRYIMGCLPPGEKVLTDEGLMFIEDVDEKNQLIDEKGDFVDIINKQEYNVVDEDIYEICVDNTYRTTKFTKEHPILISKPILRRNWKKHNNLKFKERYWDWNFNYAKSSDVCVGDWIKVPNVYRKNLNFDIDEKWFIEKNIRTDFLIDSPLSKKDFWWVVGLWLGDGWIGKYKYGYSITVCFNKKESYYIKKYEKIIKELFKRNPTFRERNSTYDVSFNSKELYYFILENFGQYSYGKKINEWIKYIPIEFKKELIKGYFDSDGCWLKTFKNNKINSKITFISINHELLEGIQDILFSLGIVSSLNKLRNESIRNICGKISKYKLTYNLTLSNFDSLQLINLLNDTEDIKLNKFDLSDFSNINKRSISSCHIDKNGEYIYFRIKKINKSKFSGKVYNFETKTHSFMCRHITTHNCDVSRGDSEDYSAINIIDFDEREQVLEYIGKIPPDDLASLAYKWGIIYQAFIVVDITGGMGIATSRKLQEMQYKNLYIDGINTQNIWEYDAKLMEKIPGISFNNKRTQIIAAFEEQIRHGFLIRSVRLTNEMNTFVFINGKPDHMKGTHDDSIMSIAMAMFVGDVSFTQLVRNELQNKAMIDAWMLSERSYEPNNSLYSYGKAFDPLGAVNTETGKPIPNPIFNYPYNDLIRPQKELYQQYSWLFGKHK